MNKELIGKVDDLMAFHTKKVDEILNKIENTEQRKQNEEIGSIRASQNSRKSSNSPYS